MEDLFSDHLPDFKDIETKIGRKIPEGLSRWLREDPVILAGGGAASPREASLKGAQPDYQGLSEKIRTLKLELACLRAIDVKILQQLSAVNEGIEAVKWLFEEKGTLTSRCSSLTSSQYSLVDSQDTSRRGSWNSLQDPSDRLDSISIGSYLDTLADDMDEYCHTVVEPVMSSTPGRPDIPTVRTEFDWVKMDHDRVTASGQSFPFYRADQERMKVEHEWPRTNPCLSKVAHDQFRVDQCRVRKEQAPQKFGMANGFLGKQGAAFEQSMEHKPIINKGSPKFKMVKNGKVEFEKLNSKVHVEYDSHWHWVQSQDDVTFL